MFKSGDRVICMKIHDKRIKWVTVGNVYTVDTNISGLDYFSTINNHGIVGHYSNDDFILLIEYRKLKINRIRERLCVK